MSQEPILDQIARLRDAFNAAATGDYAHPSQEGLLDDVSDLSPETKLLASNRVISFLLSHSIELSQKQIKHALDFLKLTVFFGRTVLNNSDFWTNEVKHDLEYAQSLLALTDSKIRVVELLQSVLNETESTETTTEIPPTEDAGPASPPPQPLASLLPESKPDSRARQAHTALLALVNWHRERFSSKTPGYNKEEKPRLPENMTTEACFQELRQKQMENTIAHAELLRDIAVIYLKRMQIIVQDLLPSDPDNSEWRKGCQKALNAAYQSGLDSLINAEDFLTCCAARYSSFPRVLTETQRAATPRPH